MDRRDRVLIVTTRLLLTLPTKLCTMRIAISICDQFVLRGRMNCGLTHLAREEIAKLPQFLRPRSQLRPVLGERERGREEERERGREGWGERSMSRYSERMAIK